MSKWHQSRDSLQKTKQGRAAVKKIEKIRVAALRKKSINALTLNQIERKNSDRPLTDKQRMFVRHWAAGETPRTAAVMAGYAGTSHKISWTMSNDPAIRKLYLAEKKAYEEAAGHTKARLMSMLQEAYDHAKLVSEPATMVAAVRELGKMAGHYEPERKIVDVRVGGKLFDRLNSLTDEELLKMLAEPDDEDNIIDVVPESKLLTVQ